MKVLIKIINLSQALNIYADDKTNEVVINNTPVNYNANKFVGDVSAITFNWDNHYYKNHILDGEEFKIKLISDNNNERLIVGKNSYPSNYGEFKDLINEVVNLWN